MNHDDPETLRRLYHDEGLSTHEMADRLDCSSATVHKYMKRFGIERDPPTSERPPYFSTHPWYGHEFVQTKVEGQDKRFLIHRLVAVAEHGFEAVAGNVIHHKNGIPWDNRPPNLEILTQSEHAARHNTTRDVDFDRDERGRFV